MRLPARLRQILRHLYLPQLRRLLPERLLVRPVLQVEQLGGAALVALPLHDVDGVLHQFWKKK
jgi:ABC-type siderophore export system fused ATPase/permease subunit